MKTGIVVGAAPLEEEWSELADRISSFTGANKSEGLILIAADGGIDFFAQSCIAPDYWIGDMDSAKNRYNVDSIRTQFPQVCIESCSPIKDVTDMEIAITMLIEKGCEKIFCYGGLGGKRISHSLANISLMQRLTSEKTDIYFIGSGTKMYVLKPGKKVVYDSSKKGYISVLALTDIARDVVIKGLYYEYSGDLYSNNALGVSNEFCDRKAENSAEISAEISVGQGELLIVEEY